MFKMFIKWMREPINPFIFFFQWKILKSLSLLCRTLLGLARCIFISRKDKHYEHFRSFCRCCDVRYNEQAKKSLWKMYWDSGDNGSLASQSHHFFVPHPSQQPRPSSALNLAGQTLRLPLHSESVPESWAFQKGSTCVQMGGTCKPPGPLKGGKLWHAFR